MDEKTLLEAVSGHVGLLEGLQWWMLVTAMAAIYMVAADKDELDLKFFKVKRENAAELLGALYLVATTAFFVVLVRLYGLIEALPDAQIPAAVTKILTHSWLFNPFAYFGDSPLYQFASLASLLALIAVWFLGPASLALPEAKRGRATGAAVFSVVFVALSISVLIVMQQVYFLLESRTAQVKPELSAALAALKESRLSVIGWGSLVALVASLVAVHLIERHKRAKEKESEAMRLSVASLLD